MPIIRSAAVTLLLLLVALPAVAAPAASQPTRPNFVVINIDDLGYADIGPFGGRVATPELDRMAREGRTLRSHYAAPVCSPSRAALMTGCYPKRVLPIPGVLFPESSLGLHPDERTIAEVLRDAGYATAMVGKWHLGDQPEFLPTRQGFERFFGLPYSNDMGPVADGIKSDRGDPLPERGPPKDGGRLHEFGRLNLQPPLPLLEDERVVGRIRPAEHARLTREFTERAAAFIRGAHQRPFFLYLAHSAVHFPMYPHDEFVGRSGHGLLGDWVQEVDWSVGQVLAALRESGLDRDTLVLFTSDNGGATKQGSQNTPLRGGKGTTFEGGVRVCTIAWWPGRIPAGSATTAMTSMMDVLPTFAALAGAPLDRPVDGVDVWPVLAGDPAQPPRDTFLYYRGLVLEAVRSGAWKLALASGELYQLDDDIGETVDVAAAHPEVVARLRALAASTDGDLGREGVGPGCRPLGRNPSPRPLIPHDTPPEG